MALAVTMAIIAMLVVKAIMAMLAIKAVLASPPPNQLGPQPLPPLGRGGHMLCRIGFGLECGRPSQRAFK